MADHPSTGQPLASQQQPGTPRVDYQSPDVRDTVLTDVLDTKGLADYAALANGSANPDWVKNPAHRLVKTIAIDWRYVQRVYARDRDAQDVYNYGITYDEDSKDHPIYTRDYLERREDYTRRTDLSALPGIYRIDLTAGGSGYLAAPTVSFSGGTGSGAAATALISNGAVVGLAITAEGSYTVAPTVVFTPVNGGTGAAATAYVQSQSALLVSEDVIATPDSPTWSLYFLVRRVYHTLPGCLVAGTHMNPDAQGELTEFTRQKLAYGTPPLTPDYQLLSYEDRPLSRNIIQRFTDRAINDFPTLTEYDQDDLYLSRITTTYEVVDASLVTPPSIIAGTITSYKKLDEWRSLKIVRVFALPTDVNYESENGAWLRPYLFDFENMETPYQYSDECGAFGVRYSAQAILCPHKTITKFSTSVDSTEGLVFNTNAPLMGKYLNFTNIINDEFDFTYTGTCTGTVTVPASTPDFTTYTGTYQGTFQLMQVSSKLWKALLYRSVYLYIRLP